MSQGNISICVLFPDLLGTYGDGGNAVVLSKRAEWRDIPAEILYVNMGDAVPERCDLYLLGGGEDQPQSSVTSLLDESKVLHRAVDRGAVVLAICAGMQILGNEFAVEGGESRSGLGLLDIVTVRGTKGRSVGEITVQPTYEFGNVPLTGYENHGGVTKLGSNAKPLGRVITGRGNNDGSKMEGAVGGRVVGTYLHGPVLARNPTLADSLLEMIVGETLSPLDDVEIDRLRKERFEAAEAEYSGLVKRVKRLVSHSAT